MKSREEISIALSNSLTSAAWLQLKNGMVGKELIALGTEIIYRSALTQEAFTAGMDYQNCDFCDLCGLGRRNDIAVSDFEPSYITKVVENPIKPYDEVLSVGGVSFRANEFAGSGSTVTGYEGVAREIYSTTSFGIFSGAEVSQQAVTDNLKVNINGHTYIRLGRNVMPKSVRFYVKIGGAESATEMPQYDPTLFGTSGYVKVVTLEDGCIAIEIPNDTTNWTTWSCYYIDLLHTDFDATTQTGIVDMYIGSEGNLEYARKQYGSEVAKFYVLASEEDILKYVRNHEGVVDARVITDGSTRSVQVYIKPNKGASVANYSNLRYDLTLHSNILSEYGVSAGSGVSFQFTITGAEKYERPSIESEVRDMYAYEDMMYDTPVIASDVAAKVFTDLGIRVDASIKVTENNLSIDTDGVHKMTMAPIATTIRVLGDNQALTFVTAFDAGGLLYKPLWSSSAPKFTVPDMLIGCFAHAIVMKAATNSYYIYDVDTNCSIDVSAEFSTLTAGDSVNHDIVWINSSTNPMFVCNNKLYVLYDSLFWSAPTQSSASFALMFSASVSDTTLFNYDSGQFGSIGGSTVNYFRQTAVVVNGVVHSFKQSVVDNVISYTLYRVSATQTYVAMPLGTIGTYLKGIMVSDGRVLLFGKNGGVFELLIDSGYSLAAMNCDWLKGLSVSSYDCLFYKECGAVMYRGSDASYKGMSSLSKPIIVGNSLSLDENTIPMEIEGTPLFIDTRGSLVSGYSAKPAVLYSCPFGTSTTYIETGVYMYRGGALWSAYALAYSEATKLGNYPPKVIGTVDYENAEMNLSAGHGLSGGVLKYEASRNAPRHTMEYFMLNEDEPIIWQE